MPETHKKISTGTAENKFGVPLSRARDVYAQAAKLKNIRITGVDMHIGSQMTDLSPFDNAAALLAELARDLMAAGHKLEHIDFGGGLGIPYRTGETPPLPKDYAEVVKRHTRSLGLKLVFEIGRMIVGNAGVLVTRVIVVKRGEAKTFVVIDAAMNDLIRPTLYEAHHEIQPVREPQAGRRVVRRRRGRADLRIGRLSRARPALAHGARGRVAGDYDRRGLWRGRILDLQHAPTGARGSGAR